MLGKMRSSEKIYNVMITFQSYVVNVGVARVTWTQIAMSCFYFMLETFFSEIESLIPMAVVC